MKNVLYLYIEKFYRKEPSNLDQSLEVISKINTLSPEEMKIIKKLDEAYESFRKMPSFKRCRTSKVIAAKMVEKDFKYYDEYMDELYNNNKARKEFFKKYGIDHEVEVLKF